MVAVAIEGGSAIFWGFRIKFGFAAKTRHS